MNAEQFKAIRRELGLSQRATSKLFRMGTHGWRNVQRWEAGEQDIPWWAIYTFLSLQNGAPVDTLPDNCPDYILQAINIIITGDLPDLSAPE
jgi:hypothetical protein